MTKPTHYLVTTYPPWAHIRSELGLTISLLHLNPLLHVTLLIPAKRSAAAALEMAHTHIAQPERLKVLHYGDDKQEKDGKGMWNPRGGFRAECMEQLEGYAEALGWLKSVKDPLTGEHVTPHQMPYDLLIHDITLGAFDNKVKEVLKEADPKRAVPKSLGFAPYNVASMAFTFLPEYGGVLPRVDRIYAEGGEEEEKRLELYNEYLGGNADLVDIPGLWPFHVYESNPVEKESVFSRIQNYYMLSKVIRTWQDGIIFGWPAVLTPELREGMTRYFGSFYSVGFQLPPSIQDEWAVEGREGMCKAYLDESLQEGGEKSVIYISFGSVVYAPMDGQMSVMLDVLEELGCRYIMAEGNAPEAVREMMSDRIGKGRDKGLLVPWAPQRAVLSHPATGLFLTHGGSNSAMEAMLFKVPMIQWPSGFDQPFVANELDKLGVAKELLQVRGGQNVGKPMARNGTIVKGTDEALRAEVKGYFASLDTPAHKEMRTKLEELSSLLKEDRSKGRSFEQVLEISTVNQ